MINLPDDLRAVLESLRDRAKPYLVGGCVRDALLGRPPKDFDVEVFGIAGNDLANLLAEAGRISVVGRSFGVIKLRLASGEYDFSVPRRESKRGVGHRGFEVTPEPDLDEAAAASRRDFTINAILYEPFGERVVDPHGGIDDLKRGVLRHVGPAFSEDPLRVLRAFQFAARFDLTLDPTTARVCAEISGTFPELPVERVWMEWEKFATQAMRPSRGLAVLRETHWLPHFPELAALSGTPQDPDWHPEGDVFTHTGHCLDALVRLDHWREATPAERRVLTFAVLGHDFGKPGVTERAQRHGKLRWISPGHDRAGGPIVEAFLGRIGAPLELRPPVRALVEAHHVHQSWPLSGPGAAAVRRLARRLQPATIAQLVAVLRADHQGRPPLLSKETTIRIEQLEKSAQALDVVTSSPTPLLQGRDLIALGLQPGVGFGEMLRTAFEAQLEGAFASPDEAVAWARDHFMSSPDRDSGIQPRP